MPLDAPAFLCVLCKLDKADPLGCDAYYDLRPKLSFKEKTILAAATQRRHLAYDHVKLLTGRPATTTFASTHSQTPILSVYIARGRPDKWRPESKKDHRRVLKPGVWVAERPRDPTNSVAFWLARRRIALLETIGDAAPPYPTNLNRTLPRPGPPHPHPTLTRPPSEPDEPVPHNGPRAAMSEMGLARAYFYAHPDAVPGTADAVEGSLDVPLTSIELLNTHLGKAGGLNFGLEAILHTDHVKKPSPVQPWIFGIIDARHACDGRFWLHVLPAFHTVHGSNERCAFSSDIVLCQIPHSYIGMVSGKCLVMSHEP